MISKATMRQAYRRSEKDAVQFCRAKQASAVRFEPHLLVGGDAHGALNPLSVCATHKALAIANNRAKQVLDG